MNALHSPIVAWQRHMYALEHGFGAFGAGTLLTEGETGVKSGMTAATVSTAIGSSVASAVGAGAAAGSFVPIIGTAIGIIVGLIASGVFDHRTDPEVGNFNNAIATFHNNPDAIFNIADKYLVLAGLFDLEPNQIKGNIPIYKKYGRMGEQAFTQDMANLIYNAAQSGAIGPTDTPQTVMTKVVQPWIDRFGYGAMQDANAEMITDILIGMIAEYVTGLWSKRWYARSGDMPNWHIPTFTLPGGAGVSPGPSGTPTATPVSTPAPAPVPSGPMPPGFLPAGTSPQGQTLYQRANDPNLYIPYAGGGVMVYVPPSTKSPVPAPVLSPSPMTPPLAPPPTQTSAIPIPAGFSVIGTDANSGSPLYVGPDGRYYSWNGVTMSFFTGTVLSAGQSFPAQNGVISTAPPSALPSLMPSLFSPQTAAPAPINVSVAAPASAPVSPIAAGVSSVGLPTWAPWAAIGGVVLLLFATARPVGGVAMRRAR